MLPVGEAKELESRALEEWNVLWGISDLLSHRVWGKNWMDQVDAGPALSLFRCELLVGLIRKAYWRRCHLKGTLKEFQQQQMRNDRRNQWWQVSGILGK